MGRKSERNKTKKSPEKSPRRAGRPSRRTRKKSDSESSEDKTKEAKEQVEVEQTVQNKEEEVTGRTRRAARRQVIAESAEAQQQPPPEDWKEDVTFWSSEAKEDPRVENTDKEKAEGGTVWKVQTSNGSGGEIQKLRICRQRPAGSESASELSPSPDKESPVHKRNVKTVHKEVEQPKLSEIELPPAPMEEVLSKTDDANQNNTESLQPETQCNTECENKNVNLEIEESVKESEGNSEENIDEDSLKIKVKTTKESELSKEIPESEKCLEKPVNSASEEKACEISAILPESIPFITDTPEESLAVQEHLEVIETIVTEITVVSEESFNHIDESVTKENENVEAESDDKGSISERRDSRRSSKSDSSNSRRTSQASEDAGVEINVNAEVAASVLNDTREEGEIDNTDSEETESSKKEKLSNDDNSTDSKLARRLSTLSTNKASTQTSNNESAKPATTAKKHPLITGPEPDDVVKLRRRKLTATTSRIVTTGGTTRQVRSIPGEALKALIPVAGSEAEKKEADKLAARNKLLKARTDAITQRLGVAPVKKESLEDQEDVREIVNKLKGDKAEARTNKTSPQVNNDTIKSKVSDIDAGPVRKVVVGVEEVKAAKPQRSLSPGDSKATPILFITNLVRPFTATQLKELLARTGTIAPNGFYIDKIKSKCFVKYVDVEMAIETRHALNGVRWPVGNPKVLKVSYSSEKDMISVIEAVIDDKVEEEVPAQTGWLSEKAIINDRKKVKANSIREWDLGKVAGSDGDVVVIEDDDNQMKETWTVGFNKQPTVDLQKEKLTRHQAKENIVRPAPQERRKRNISPEKSPPPPVRKFKKKDYDAPARLLDDLFKKTKATPCLYWLPLTAAQIAIKEEMRRKHMAEHERRIAEMKKSELLRREKERERRRK